MFPALYGPLKLLGDNDVWVCRQIIVWELNQRNGHAIYSVFTHRLPFMLLDNLFCFLFLALCTYFNFSQLNTDLALWFSHSAKLVDTWISQKKIEC